MLLSFLMWSASLSEHGDFSTLPFKWPRRSTAHRLMGGVFIRKCCKVLVKGQHFEKSLFLHQSGSSWKCLKAHEQSGPLQFLTYKKLGWFTKDFDKHLAIWVQVQVGHLKFLRCIHACLLYCKQMQMKSIYEIVVRKCLGIYCSSLINKEGIPFCDTCGLSIWSIHQAQARNFFCLFVSVEHLFIYLFILFFFFNQLEANYFTILQWFLSYQEFKVIRFVLFWKEKVKQDSQARHPSLCTEACDNQI